MISTSIFFHLLRLSLVLTVPLYDAIGTGAETLIVDRRVSIFTTRSSPVFRLAFFFYGKGLVSPLLAYGLTSHGLLQEMQVNLVSPFGCTVSGGGKKNKGFITRLLFFVVTPG